MKANCTILWAEDDQDDINLILDAARELGIDHLIDFVSNGKEALNRLFTCSIQKRLPQLIVLDNNMPVMTGAETLQHILQYNQLKTIPLAFFTTGKEGLQIIPHHAKLFIKPTSYQTFLVTIKAILDLCDMPSKLNKLPN